LREQLHKAMKNSVREVSQWPLKEVQIFHHNDSDGLTSGAILTKAFQRAGFTIQRFCLEKPYPKLLHKIYDQKGALAFGFKPEPELDLDFRPSRG